MKLNHKEFRIGNLVEYDGRVFEIDSVSEVLPTLNTIEFGIGVVDWNNLKPIPLNEDWLKSFGFDKIGGELWDCNHVRGLFVNNELTPLAYLRPIKYVHDLMNLYFALTGTEITLTNK